MDKAKAAVSGFMSKAGKHDTTVHENVAPAVTHNTQNVLQHENVTTALDKEIHQDHYHTSVQAVKDREILPEQHHHNLKAVEHREFNHGNQGDTARRVQEEAAQFKDKHVRVEGQATQAAAPTVAGEHIHHHVHETIQPVVQKETVEQHVTHTTVPIHEVHHNAAQHHTTTALPTVSMADFKKQGGVLSGREERYDGFEGEPRSIGKSLGGRHEHDTGITGQTHTTTSTTGTHLPGQGSGHHHGSTGVGSTGSTGTGLGSTGSAGTGLGSTGSRVGTDGSIGSNTGVSGQTNSSTTGTHKASLMDKLNPMKDSNGDGKAGFMK